MLHGLGRLLWICFKGLSYASFAAMAAAMGIMHYLLASGRCGAIHTGMVSCADNASTEAANAVLSLLLLGMFTGIPLLLAIAGFIFAFRDGWRLFNGWRRKAA